MDLERISACTYPLRERDAEYALGVLADAGVKKADLWGRMPHFSEDPEECDLDELMALSEGLGGKIANLGTYPGGEFTAETGEERAAELSKMRVTIDAAVKLGCRSIRVSPGHGEDPAVVDQVAPLMAESAAYAEQRGIYLGIENHGGGIAGDPQLCKRLCEAVGSPHFGVLYEPCNLLAIEVDYREAFEVFADHIVHIHVKDGAWGDEGFARCHLGEGDIDLAWVVEAMEGIGYEGDYALEYEITEIEPIETGLAKWLAYFREL